MEHGLLQIKQIQIAGSFREILKWQAINTFSKQSLNVELCKLSKREEKEEVHSCNTKI